ncbi:hypothetical protein HBI17_119900 [Parastagonospora nodorum]|nr:hypothetical protein HBI17_119900 [Parastagonospora nodorum]
MQHYQYAPLDRESDTIRLLRLLPSEVDKAEIRVELLEYDLRHSQQSLHSYEAFSYFLRHSQQSRHSYEALSYVWGGLETTQSILIGDEELRITSNLHAALLRLRDITFPRILWVDAVCINQSDESEKELQIQSMAMIYGFAKRTIIWLGEETESSDMALEAIRLAGNKRDSIFNDKSGSSGRAGEDAESVRKAIASLLQREWFERIWVLQEVAAARHIVVVCGPTEIDGYALCLGLEQMGSTGQNASSYARARPVLALIQGAIFRSQPRLRKSGMVALDICSLGELISMYSTHSTTHSHDKIYALLGMSTDDITDTGLLPDYSVPWEELMRRLLIFILGRNICFKSGTGREEAEITGRGCIIGSVSKVSRNSNGSQNVDVKFSNSAKDLSNPNRRYTQWALRATVNDVKVYDLVYWLEGAPRPLIIRPAGLFFRIVALAVTPPTLIRRATFPQHLHLIWSWMRDGETSRTDRRFPYHLNESRSYWTAALILHHTGEKESASQLLNKLVDLQAMECSEREKTLASSSELPSGFSEPTELELADIVRSLGASYVVFFFESIGHTVSISEEVLVALVQHHRSHVIFSVIRAVRHRTDITARVLEAAAKNVNTTIRHVMDALLEWSLEDPEDLITENLLVAVIRNPAALRSGVMETLLKFLQELPKDLVTESVLVAVAQNQEAVERGVLSTLLEWSGERPDGLITETLIIAIVKNPSALKSGVLDVLLTLLKELPKVQITDAILIAVMQNQEAVERGVLSKLLRWPHKGTNDVDGNTVPYTDTLHVAVARTPEAVNKDTLEALLNRSKDHTRTFVKLVEAADTDQAFHTLLEIFWNAHYELAAIEQVLAAAVENPILPKDSTEVLCSSSNPKESERMIIQSVRYFDVLSPLMQILLFVRYQGQIPTAIWAAAATNPTDADKCISILAENTLRIRKECYITEAILVAAARNDYQGYKVLRLLLSSNNKTFKFPDGVATPKVLLAAAENPSEALAVTQLLVEYEENKTTITIPGDMMKEAALKGNASLMLFLLSVDKRKIHLPDVVSTPKMLELVAGNGLWPKKTRDEIQRSLLGYGEKQDVAQEAEKGTIVVVAT